MLQGFVSSFLSRKREQHSTLHLEVETVDEKNHFVNLSLLKCNVYLVHFYFFKIYYFFSLSFRNSTLPSVCAARGLRIDSRQLAHVWTYLSYQSIWTMKPWERNCCMLYNQAQDLSWAKKCRHSANASINGNEYYQYRRLCQWYWTQSLEHAMPRAMQTTMLQFGLWLLKQGKIRIAYKQWRSNFPRRERKPKDKKNPESYVFSDLDNGMFSSWVRQRALRFLFTN